MKKQTQFTDPWLEIRNPKYEILNKCTLAGKLCKTKPILEGMNECKLFNINIL